MGYRITANRRVVKPNGAWSEDELCVHYCKGCDELIATHTPAEHSWNQQDYCMACIKRERRKAEARNWLRGVIKVRFEE